MTFVGPLVGAAGLGITHHWSWMVGGPLVGLAVLALTLVLSRVPLRFDRGYRKAYLTSVLVNGGLYTLYMVLLTAVPGVSWMRAIPMAAGLCVAPVICARSFVQRQRRVGTMSEHARFRLDPALSNPVRLSVLAAVSDADEVEFGVIRESLDLTAPALSKVDAQLEELGYLKVRKGYVGKRPRTWLSLTRRGRAAYDGHIDALREIAGL